MKEKIQMTTPLVEMDGDEKMRIPWKSIKSISIALIIFFSIILPFSCLNGSSYDATFEDFVYCWPKGIYSGKVIEYQPYHQPIIKIITAPIEAPDSLWPCIGHHISVSCYQHQFHVGDTIVFKMMESCARYRTKNDDWWAQIEIYE